jgi:hypothetical protein
MADQPDLPKEVLKRIAGITNKRARFVLDSIVKKGIVTTEEINQAGYEHPPRAARDVRELGFRLKTIRVKHSTGRSIAAYTLDASNFEAGKGGRVALSKKERDGVIGTAGGKCQICGAEHNLQVDHRIPYEVGGEAGAGEVEAYQVLCGSCNRKKSWDCEHCRNWRELREMNVCRSCYWSGASTYNHVAMQEQRRADVVWIGEEVRDFQRLRAEAERHGRTVPDEIKQVLKHRN